MNFPFRENSYWTISLICEQNTFSDAHFLQKNLPSETVPLVWMQSIGLPMLQSTNVSVH